MAVIPLIIAWLCLFAFFRNISINENKLGFRLSILLASIWWGAILTAITEILSLLHVFNQIALIMSWCLVILVIVLLLIRTGLTSINFIQLIQIGKSEALSKINKANLVVLIVLLMIQVMALCSIAIKYAPNNWDSMTYHLGRVMHWQQEQSVANFATNIDRQVQLQPFAEFIVSHLIILSGNDYLVNLAQWFAMLLSGVGVTLIAKQLGGSLWQQVGAAAICWTIPMGVLQATSTQNDFVNAFWLVCFASLGISFLKTPRNYWLAISMGLALGLGLLTKATSYIFAFPFCIWFGFAFIRNLPLKKLMVIGLCIVIPAILLNSGYFLRNYDLYSSQFGPQDMYVNKAFNIDGFSSNVIRNIALHIPIPLLAPYNNFTAKALERVHTLTGLSPIDFRFSFGTDNPFSGFASLDEDYSGNPFHWILICFVLLMGFSQLFTLIKIKLNENALPTLSIFWSFNLMICFGFCLFSLYLKWQPFHSRLQLPLFVLWSPVLAIALLKPNYKISAFIPFLLIFTCYVWILYNPNRPLLYNPYRLDIPRDQQYFTKKGSLYPVYIQMIDLIQKNDCHEIGLKFMEDTWEYPIWGIFRNRNYPIIIRHINVDNPTKKFILVDFKPCAIISDLPEEKFESPNSLVKIEGYSLYLNSR